MPVDLLENYQKILRLARDMRAAQRAFYKGQNKPGSRKRFLLAVALERQLDAELEGLALDNQLSLFGGQS